MKLFFVIFFFLPCGMKENTGPKKNIVANTIIAATNENTCDVAPESYFFENMKGIKKIYL